MSFSYHGGSQARGTHINRWWTNPARFPLCLPHAIQGGAGGRENTDILDADDRSTDIRAQQFREGVHSGGSGPLLPITGSVHGPRTAGPP